MSFLSPDMFCMQVAPMNDVRGSLAAIALDQKLYAMGGGQPAVNRDTTEVYHAQRNQWLAGPIMHFRRFTTAAALHNNSIFVSGGYDGNQYLKSVERLDPREGKWKLVRGYICMSQTVLGQTQTIDQVDDNMSITRLCVTNVFIDSSCLHFNS